MIIKVLLQFASIMLIVGMLMGLITREIERLDPYNTVPAGLNIETRLDLSIMHGHTLIMGSILPCCVAVMIVISKFIGVPDIRYRSLKISIGMYIGGTIGALILLFYKGIHLAVLVHDMVNDGTVNFADVDSKLFGGSLGFRSTIYAIVHIIMGAGLMMFAASLLIVLGKVKFIS